MMTSRLHLLIFGASGFTGKYAVLEMVNLAKEHSLTWGVAGRNLNKLQDVLQWVAIKTDNSSVNDIPIVIADVSNDSSLDEMAKRTHVLINCCGPYRHFGYPVVKACVENGAHYLDVSGEPYFMEKIQLDFHEAAKKAGVYVISGCGFDSIPADLGTVYLSQVFEGTLNSVETYLSSASDKKRAKNEAAIHYATWESAVYGLAFAEDLRPLRRSLFVNKMPKFQFNPPKRYFLHKNFDGRWCLPFPGADRSVVYRTQRHLYFEKDQKPISMNAYIAFDSFFQALQVVLVGAVFTLLCRFQWGRNLLLNHPRFFSNDFVSHKGPSEEYMNHTKFAMKFIAEGWPGKHVDMKDPIYQTPPTKRVVAEITGTNPGYGFTATALLLSGIMVLSSQVKNLPDKGGVYTPGAAFGNTTLMKELFDHGMTFNILSELEINQQSKL